MINLLNYWWCFYWYLSFSIGNKCLLLMLFSKSGWVIDHFLMVELSSLLILFGLYCQNTIVSHHSRPFLVHMLPLAYYDPYKQSGRYSPPHVYRSAIISRHSISFPFGSVPRTRTSWISWPALNFKCQLMS